MAVTLSGRAMDWKGYAVDEGAVLDGELCRQRDGGDGDAAAVEGARHGSANPSEARPDATRSKDQPLARPRVAARPFDAALTLARSATSMRAHVNRAHVRLPAHPRQLWCAPGQSLPVQRVAGPKLFSRQPSCLQGESQAPGRSRSCRAPQQAASRGDHTPFANQTFHAPASCACASHL